MEPELHIGLYFKKIENHIFRFQKNLKKLDVDIDEYLNHAKSQFEILCILYFELHKNNKIIDLSITNSESPIHKGPEIPVGPTTFSVSGPSLRPYYGQGTRGAHHLRSFEPKVQINSGQSLRFP